MIRDAYDDTTDVFQLLDDAEQGLFDITQQNLSRSYESMGTLAGKALKALEESVTKKIINYAQSIQSSQLCSRDVQARFC